MQGVANVMELVLLAAITVSLATWSMPWANKIIGESFELGEVSTVETQFKACSEKILETARIGTINKCIFSISKGEINGKKEGIEYSIVTHAPICDPHPLMLVDEYSHIYQECIKQGESRIYKMLWMFPLQLEMEGIGVKGNQLEGETPVGNVIFSDPINFLTLTLFVEFEYNEGESGNTVQLSRRSLSEDKIEMTVKIY